MASHCVVETKIVVSNDFKSNWVPDTKEVDNMVFMRISKWDRCFVRFCTNKALQFTGGPRQDVNVGFVEQLQRLRTAAADAALAAAFRTSADGSQKTKRIRKARRDDAHIVQPVLVMTCPPLLDEDEQMHGTHVMNVLFGIKNSDIWVEAVPSNLEYIRLGVVMSLRASQTGRRWRSKGGDDDHEGDDGDGSQDGVVAEVHEDHA